MTSRRQAVLAAGAAALSALHFASFFDPKLPIYTDIRYFVYFAWRMAHGGVPHLELFDNKTFGSHAVAAVFYRVGHALGVDELMTIRLCCLAVCALGGGLIFVVFRRFDEGRSVAGFLGLFAYLGFGFIGAFTAIGNFPKLFMPVLALVAALLVRRDRWFWAGVMGGLAFLDWQIGVLVGVGAGAAALLDGERRWRSLFFVLLGGVCCLIPVVLYYVANDAFDVALQQTVLASLSRAEDTLSRFTTWDRVMKVWALALDYCPGRQWLLVPALGGLLLIPAWGFRLRRGVEARMLMVLSVYHCGVLAFSLVDFQKFGDFFLVLSSLAFTLGLVWLELYRGARAGLARWGPVSLKAEHALAAVVFALAFWVARPAFLHPEIAIRVRPIAPGTTLDEQKQVAAQVRERTRGQRLVMLGASELLYLMRYVNPLPIIYFNRPAMSVYGRSGETEPEAMARVIREAEPDAFVLPGRRRLSSRDRVALERLPYFEGFSPDIVSTDSGSYGVILFTRDTPRPSRETP